MHTLIVLSHPEPTSFNAALADVAKETLGSLGHTVEVSDLYRQGFDPAESPAHYEPRIDPDRFSALAEQRHASRENQLPPDVQREIRKLERADLVILQFPLWWHAQPAMLKGWFDRVFVSGGLYTSSMRYDRGYFQGKRAICSVTTGAPEDAFGGDARGGDIDTMLWPVQYSMHYMGFSVLPAFVAHGIQGHGYAYTGASKFEALLTVYKQRWGERLRSLNSVEPLPFPGWDDWQACVGHPGSR